MMLCGGGGRRLGRVGSAAGSAAAGGGVSMVTEVSQAGAARVTCAVAWRRREELRDDSKPDCVSWTDTADLFAMEPQLTLIPLSLSPLSALLSSPHSFSVFSSLPRTFKSDLMSQ